MIFTALLIVEAEVTEQFGAPSRENNICECIARQNCANEACREPGPEVVLSEELAE